MEVVFIDGDAAHDAIREVRDADGSDTNWMAVTYDNPKTMKMRLLGKGTGGADELAGLLQPDMAVYALIRVVDRIDNSDTVKFVFVLFLGEKLNRMLRARISVHQNSVKEFIGQAHVDYSCSTAAELNNDIIVSKVTITSGSSSRVIDDSGRPIGLGGKDSAAVTGRVAASKKEEINTDSFAEGQDAVREGLLAVRSDTDETVWALFEFDGSKLVFLEKGTGSVDDEVVPKLRSNAMMYALVRKIERFELTDTVKFAFITYTGSDVPFMLRGRLNAYSSMIDEAFSPYHVVVHAEVPSEVSDKIIVDAIAAASGTADHVLDAVPEAAAAEPAPAPVYHEEKPVVHHEEKPKPKPEPKKHAPAASPVKSGDEPRPRDALYFNEEEECRAALAEVRNDECPTVWAVFGTDKATGGARLLGKGIETEEMYSLLTDKVVAWVLLRRSLKIDESVTTKFVFINWIGDNIPRMLRARLGTWSGVVQEFIQPYHVDINASSLDEITEDILMNTIEEAAGTKIHVLA